MEVSGLVRSDTGIWPGDRSYRSSAFAHRKYSGKLIETTGFTSTCSVITQSNMTTEVEFLTFRFRIVCDALFQDESVWYPC